MVVIAAHLMYLTGLAHWLVAVLCRNIIRVYQSKEDGVKLTQNLLVFGESAVFQSYFLCVLSIEYFLVFFCFFFF